MTRIVAVEPIFAISDMVRAAEHYERLGFEVSYYDEGYAFAQPEGHPDGNMIRFGSPLRSQ